LIVVDTNIVAYLYLPGEHTARAEALLERDPDWAAPLLWRSEFRNILAGYLRRRVLSWEQACALQAEAENLLSGAEYEVDSRRAVEPVRDSDCSTCDCEFVARAVTLGVKLVTMDGKLLKAFPAHATPIGVNSHRVIGIRALNGSPDVGVHAGHGMAGHVAPRDNLTC
jgi:predicted nucleic acid-binding protein